MSTRTTAPADHTEEVRGNTRAMFDMALASAITAQGGAGARWHAEPPSKESLNELAKLLDMEPLDALMHLLLPIIQTVNTVVTRTAQREQVIMGGDGMFVSVNGLTSALSMSLADFQIAMGTVGGLEAGAVVEQIAAVLKRERDAGTLEATLAGATEAANARILDAKGKAIAGD